MVGVDSDLELARTVQSVFSHLRWAAFSLFDPTSSQHEIFAKLMHEAEVEIAEQLPSLDPEDEAARLRSEGRSEDYIAGYLEGRR